MVANNLKEFNNEWILFGLLFFCLMTFTVTFMANNNEGGLGNSADKFSGYSSDVQGNLVGMEDTSNSLLNISAQNDPEISNLGSKDSVATSYGVFGNAKLYLVSFTQFVGWMFTGTAGQVIIGVIGGMFALTGLYFITKWIRTGT